MTISLFENHPALIGMVHLDALPGAPRFSGDIETVIAHACADARVLRDAGFDAVMMENYHDTPFFSGSVPPVTVAAMTRAALAIRAEIGGLPLGINVLRNDGHSALAIAEATNAQFIRVNVLTGAAVTDQGLIEADAARLLRARAALGSSVQIFADVGVKHAKMLGDDTLAPVAQETVYRAHADGIIISGIATGAPTEDAHLAAARAAVPGTPVLIGSGVSPNNLPQTECDGMIVGSWLKIDGRVNRTRAEQLVASVRC